MAVLPDPLVNALHDRYRLERELGAGGMATVYLAHDLRHDRQVALKVLLPELARVVGPERFQREIRLAARLPHPHILSVHDSGEAAGSLWFTMPFVDGESLRERLRRETQLPVKDALQIAKEIASALSYSHARGVIHRDIKPENILLSNGMAMLADFGIAHALDPSEGPQLTATGLVIGTPEYMSPEQGYAEHELDARSDVYSLGTVLYEMLAGEPPFSGRSAQAVIVRRLSGVVPPLRPVRPTVPVAIERAVMKALALAKADRFATAEEFASALFESDVAHPKLPSVAILPFLNLSPDPENEYFADGMTEDVIAHVSKIRALKVISRTSVMLFKKRTQSLREIGAALEATTLLEGSVRRAGDRVRIVAQLIDAETDQHLWAETYDRQLTDIFAIQTDVALRIAAALRAELTRDETIRIRKEPTSDLEAYQLYLQGRHAHIRWTEEGLRKGIEYFERAIAKDPKYAMAHVGVGMAYTELGETGVLNPAEAYRRAKEAAVKALALDSELGQAHCVLAFVKFVTEFDWLGAEEEFKRALELTPNDADTYDLYGRLCSALARHDEAVVMQKRAQELDPLAHKADAATALLRAGAYDAALQAAERAIHLDPRDARGHATLGWVYVKKGRYEKGLAHLETAVLLTPDATMWLAQLGQAFGIAGNMDKARDVLRQLEERSAHGYVSPYHWAYVYTGLGEPDRAIDYLERAYDERAGAVYGIKGSFLFTTLHSHPRFTALLRKMNLA